MKIDVGKTSVVLGCLKGVRAMYPPLQHNEFRIRLAANYFLKFSHDIMVYRKKIIV